jgi:hypothetical protein
LVRLSGDRNSSDDKKCYIHIQTKHSRARQGEICFRSTAFLRI